MGVATAAQERQSCKHASDCSPPQLVPHKATVQHQVATKQQHHLRRHRQAKANTMN